MTPQISTGSSGMMAFQASSSDEAIMLEQNMALDQIMQDIVRSSTIKHDAIGAAVGCGLAVVSATGHHRALRLRPAGGVVGAISGHVAGKRDVTRRMELVSANALVCSIRKSNDQLGDIATDLPHLLSQQDADVKTLEKLNENSAISAKGYAACLQSIRASRAELSETLLMSSQRARIASENLRDVARAIRPRMAHQCC